MSEELFPIRDLFDDVQSRINDILGIVQRQFEVPYANLDQQANKMLKIYQSSKQERGEARAIKRRLPLTTNGMQHSLTEISHV